MSSRPAFRAFANTYKTGTGFTFRSNGQTFRSAFRRQQTTAANPAVEAAPQTTFQRLWNSPIGVKTVHFWAPVMKWGLVIAGIGDFFRPAEKLSLTQNLALMATGSIWTRWCFVIRPQNMLLAAVNFCLFCVGTVQVTRILTLKKDETGSTKEAVKELGQELKVSAVSAEKTAETKLA